MTDRLFLADRGYPGLDYFETVEAHGGAFIVQKGPALTAALEELRAKLLHQFV